MRKIKGSWLKAFCDWTLPRSETPESMIKWTGLFTIASVVKRKVWFPRRLLGSYDIYPNLYIIFVAKPGVARKTTTIKFAEDLLLRVAKSVSGESITFAPDVTSYSKLIQVLSDSPDSSATIMSSEFSSLIQTTPEAMYELLTDIFDNKRKLEWSTWSHGDKTIENPVVNLLAATTPDWVASQPREYFAGGGFASRVLFVFESKRRQFKMYYDDINYDEMEKMEKNLASDLEVISNIKGEFKHDSEATKKYIEEWYQEHANKGTEDAGLQGFAERKHVHAHKVSMLLSLAERDDRVITKEHWNEATKLLEEVETKIPSALSAIGANPLGKQMNEILEFLEEKGSADLKRLAGKFYRDLTLEQLRSALTFLTTIGKIKTSGSVSNPTYTYVGK